MKKILLGFSFLFFVGFIQAQSISFNGGDKLFSFSTGYITKLYNGTQWKPMLPPLAINYDMCIIDSIGKMRQAIGIGAVVNLQKVKTEYNSGTSDKKEGIIYHLWSIGLRPTYHFYVKRKTDVYAGILAWYIHQDMTKYGTIQVIPPTDSMSGFKAAFFIGYRYYVGKQFAFFGEFETHVTWLNFGLTFRFR